MITISIPGEAFAAIRAMLPKAAQVTPVRLGEGGGLCITLDLQTIDHLTAIRGTGESFTVR
jgi:hypothetical protein